MPARRRDGYNGSVNTKRRLPKSAIIGFLFAAFLLALMVYSSAGLRKVSCDICITFNGSTVCRRAEGKTRQDAVRTATDNACSGLYRDMAENIRCSNTPPKSVDCR